MTEKSKTVAENRKARHDYFVEDSYEAGIELCGTEVKSIRAGQVNLKDSFCSFANGEIFAENIHISPYEKGNIFNKDPRRKRKLLMHKKEILRIKSLADREGYTVIPLSIYFKGSHLKMNVGLCKGKKLYDKRETEMKKSLDMENRRIIKANERY
ncbi:MAG: SsrA-binding protein SmpB [Ruminococcaceae bacterium]|nr:SsrA-binding protein SmpB [Oscillospiraceae bacterium]